MGYFQCFTIMNKAAVNILFISLSFCIHMFSFLLVKTQNWDGSITGRYLFTFKRSSQNICQRGCIPPAMYRSPGYSMSKVGFISANLPFSYLLSICLSLFLFLYFSITVILLNTYFLVYQINSLVSFTIFLSYYLVGCPRNHNLYLNLNMLVLINTNLISTVYKNFMFIQLYTFPFPLYIAVYKSYLYTLYAHQYRFIIIGFSSCLLNQVRLQKKF